MHSLYVEGNLDKLIFDELNEFLSHTHFEYQKPFRVFQAHSISSVLVNLENQNNLIGVIDNDKVKSELFNYYEICKEKSKTIYLHKSRNTYLIVLDKAAEDWIINVSEQLEIDKTNYELPDDLDGFIKLKKNFSNRNKHNLRRLIKKIFLEANINSNDEINYLVKIFKVFIQKKK